MSMIRFALGEVGLSRSSAATASAISSRFVAPRFPLPEGFPAFGDVLRIMFHAVMVTDIILASGFPKIKPMRGRHPLDLSSLK